MKIPKTFIPDKNLEKKTEELLTERKSVFKYASKYNKLKADDERVQYFYDLWCEEAFTSTDVQKFFLAEAYCIHVLGVSEKTFKDFAEGAYSKAGQPYPEPVGQPYNPWPKRVFEIEFAERAIGLRQGGAIERRDNLELFWNAMQIFFPSDYTEEDIDYLANAGDIAVFKLVHQFETFGAHPLFKALKINA